MNKPFTLEEYKKNPGRLVWSHGSFPTIDESALLFNDRHLCVRADTATWTYRIADVPRSLALATEYEVRRARPWHYLDTERVLLTKPPGDQSFAWEFVGPEFEYKVEKP